MSIQTRDYISQLMTVMAVSVSGLVFSAPLILAVFGLWAL